MLILIHRSSIDDMRKSIKKLATKLTDRYDTGIRFTDRAIHIDTTLAHKHIDIYGRSGDPTKYDGLLPDFWYSDRRDMDFWFQNAACRVGGIRLDDWKDVLKIVEILVRDNVK